MSWLEEKTVPPTYGSVTLEGDPCAVRWPVVWRFQNNWHIVEVTKGVTCIWFYCQTHEGKVFRYFSSFYARYVAVRLGPSPVTFWVTDKGGQALSLDYQGLIIPALLRQNTSQHGKEAARKIAKIAEFLS